MDDFEAERYASNGDDFEAERYAFNGDSRSKRSHRSRDFDWCLFCCRVATIRDFVKKFVRVIVSRGNQLGAFIANLPFCFVKERDRRHSHGSRSTSKSKSSHSSSSHPGSRPESKSAPFPMFPNMFPAARHARRVYVAGLPPTANEQSIATFFSLVMSAIGGNAAGPGDAVVNVHINHEKRFACVEMRSVEEASNAMALDGIVFEGAPVMIRRPSGYNPALAGSLGPTPPNPRLNLAAVGLALRPAGGLEGSDRIFVGGLPNYFTESVTRELLGSFGRLQGFDLVKDRETGNSKGYAFCVYYDASVTDIVCATLDGIKMGDNTLTVRRADQPRQEQESMLLDDQHQVAMQNFVLQAGPPPTKVVCLTEVFHGELKYFEEYEDIMEDMIGEGEKYGKLVSIAIPGPSPTGEQCPGFGKVFMQYADVEGSTKARMGFNGRKFRGNHVRAVFYQEAKFAKGEYDG